MHKVLFYRTASGNEVVLDFVRQLSAEEKKVVGEDLKTVQIGFPMGLPLCRPLGDGLYEIRSSLPSKREFRLIFFFDRERQCLLVAHARFKKSAKLPKSDLNLARKRKEEFR
ncbi:MAG TPA: type II toxin-antitoxin system RelE/ParE family toxin [Allosphingosinicella sp.]|jgi:phage-related protein|nr:type II toxin-antitoxin system RelE/ParE family toxin [Allosphingosinicella sp.]